MLSLPALRVRFAAIAAMFGLVLLIGIGCDSSDSDEPSDDSTLSPTVSTTPAVAATPEPPPLNLLSMVLVTPDEVPTEIYTEYEVLVGDLITDVEDYWATWFEEQGASWQPPRVYTRAEGEAELRCDDNVLDVEGSFYCPAENYVAFAESRQVLPLYLYLGDYAVAMVISHEFGHAVQSSLAIEHVRDRFKELQADCFAGAWFKDYQDDGSFRDLAEPFTQAVSAMRTVDQGETLSERYDALLTGFNGGPKACIDEFPESGFDFDLAADE